MDFSVHRQYAQVGQLLAVAEITVTDSIQMSMALSFSRHCTRQTKPQQPVPLTPTCVPLLAPCSDKGTAELLGDEWMSYLRTMPHAEYPSGELRHPSCMTCLPRVVCARTLPASSSLSAACHHTKQSPVNPILHHPTLWWATFAPTPHHASKPAWLTHAAALLCCPAALDTQARPVCALPSASS
jgi:hypothetical protein